MAATGVGVSERMSRLPLGWEDFIPKESASLDLSKLSYGALVETYSSASKLFKGTYNGIEV